MIKKETKVVYEGTMSVGEVRDLLVKDLETLRYDICLKSIVPYADGFYVDFENQCKFQVDIGRPNEFGTAGDKAMAILEKVRELFAGNRDGLDHAERLEEIRKIIE